MARLPCCFRLQAPFAKTMVCIALANLSISYATCCFLYAFHASHTPFFNLFVIFFENLLPALVGEHDFQKCMNAKSCQKKLLRPSNRTDYKLFMAPGICKIGGENVYFSFMCPLWRLCLPLCVLPHAFCMKLTCFRHPFVMILLQN